METQCLKIGGGGGGGRECRRPGDEANVRLASLLVNSTGCPACRKRLSTSEKVQRIKLDASCYRGCSKISRGGHDPQILLSPPTILQARLHVHVHGPI